MPHWQQRCTGSESLNSCDIVVLRFENLVTWILGAYGSVWFRAGSRNAKLLVKCIGQCLDKHQLFGPPRLVFCSNSWRDGSGEFVRQTGEPSFGRAGVGASQTAPLC